MKLFQQLLVASAALSFIAPIGAQASDVINLEGMNDYNRSKKSTSKRFNSNTFVNTVNEDLAIIKSRVDGLEAQQNGIEAGAFSTTTTMDGKAIMWIGAVDGANDLGTDDNQSVQTGYTYTMNLNTSFSGDDNLYVRLKAGNAGSVWGLKETYHIDRKGTSDNFNVDKMWYSFPLGDNITAFAGPRIENYYMYITPSIYKPGALKSMKLGGNSNFGASTDTGYGFKYETEGGFGLASNIVTKNADSDGMLGKNDHNKWDTQIAYTTDRWHISATLSDQQGWTGQQYNGTSAAVAIADADGEDATGYAYRAYWTPEESGTAVPEITVGYDTRSADDSVAAGAAKDSDSYFVGLTWKDMFQPDDRVGVAFTQPLAVTSCNGTCTGDDVDGDPFIWEAYYSFKPNDSMEIRPAIFGGSEVEESTDDDLFGAVVTTSFKF